MKVAFLEGEWRGEPTACRCAVNAICGFYSSLLWHLESCSCCCYWVIDAFLVGDQESSLCLQFTEAICILNFAGVVSIE